MSQERHEWNFIKNDEFKLVKHFKRETLESKDSLEYLYIYRGIAIHSETKEKLVVYSSAGDTSKIWVRPYNMWMEEVDHKKYPDIKQKYRFELVKIPEKKELEQIAWKTFEKTTDAKSYEELKSLLNIL